MKRRIYIFIVLTISLFVFHNTALGNVIYRVSTPKENNQLRRQYNKEKRKMEIQEPVLSSITLNADLFGFAYSIFSQGITTAEIGMEIGFRNHFFPTVELGYGWADSDTKSSNINYQTKAPYFRIGMDYNMMYKKHQDCFITLGLRYGHSSFDYSVTGMRFDSPYHGTTLNFDIDNAHSKADWFELVFGLRAMFWKNFGMSWSLRFKMPFKITDNTNSKPWYVPGYGKNRETSISGSYRLLFSIPFKMKAK